MVAAIAGAPPRDFVRGLLGYLQRYLEVSDLHYREAPVPVTGGWEADIYRFQLGSREALPDPFTRPLIVRAYSSKNAQARSHREFDLQTYAAEHGYATPRPLFLEDDGTLFGGPFMLMEQVPGQTLLEVLLHNFTTIWWAPAAMAETQARLHQLPPPRSAPSQPWLSRQLAALEEAVQEYRLYGLAPGFDWLDNHQPAPLAEECLIHLDFHPINLIFEGKSCQAVLDWSEADVGDRHADLAATLILIDSAPIDLSKLRQRLATAMGKILLGRWYLRAYRKQLPVDADRLRYFLAWAAFRRLCTWGKWLRAGPQVTGYKPAALQSVRPDRIVFLRQAFEKRTGVAIKLL